jgi:pimeloyl-ACP methyl ester carboxylesterase
MLDTITVGNLTLKSAEPAPASAAGFKPPILFIPGFFASAWVYESYLAFFAERGYAGFALNLRGREGSSLPAGTMLGRVSMNDFIDDARQLATWLTDRIGMPIVFGHSMGGLIAQKLGEEGLARALVLLSSAPPRGISVLTASLLRRQIKYLPAILRSKRVEPRWKDMRALVLNRLPESEQKESFARFVADSGRAGREMSTGRVRVDAERVRENGCKVLIVTSDDDRFIPQRIAQRIAHRYRAPLYIARGHGHLMLREPGWRLPAEFIAGWLGREVVR